MSMQLTNKILQWISNVNAMNKQKFAMVLMNNSSLKHTFIHVVTDKVVHSQI